MEGNNVFGKPQGRDHVSIVISLRYEFIVCLMLLECVICNKMTSIITPKLTKVLLTKTFINTCVRIVVK